MKLGGYIRQNGTMGTRIRRKTGNIGNNGDLSTIMFEESTKLEDKANLPIKIHDKPVAKSFKSPRIMEANTSKNQLTGLEGLYRLAPKAESDV